MTSSDFMDGLKRVLLPFEEGKSYGLKAYPKGELISIDEEKNSGQAKLTERIQIRNNLEVEVLYLKLKEDDTSIFPVYLKKDNRINGYSTTVNPDAILFIPYENGITALILELKSKDFPEDKVRKQIRSGSAIAKYIRNVVIYSYNFSFENTVFALKGFGFKYPDKSEVTQYPIDYINIELSDKKIIKTPKLQNDSLERDIIDTDLYLFKKPEFSFDEKNGTYIEYPLSELLTIKAS